MFTLQEEDGGILVGFRVGREGLKWVFWWSLPLTSWVSEGS